MKHLRLPSIAALSFLLAMPCSAATAQTQSSAAWHPVAGRLMTSRAAVVRFLADQTPADPVTHSGPRSPSVQRAASEAAARELEDLGI